MVLRQFQDLLTGIYDLPIGYDVCDFVVTERSALSGAADSSPQEQMLVAGQGDELALSLYLDAAVLAHLAAANPFEALDAGNLGDWLTALEGVSHFVYLTFNATHDREISRLELETQAEVDKYVASLWLLRSQHPQRHPLELLPTLIERTGVDPRLPAGEAALYRCATRRAVRFCGELERRYAHEAPGPGMLRELRRFYRLNDARKLAHIS